MVVIGLAGIAVEDWLIALAALLVTFAATQIFGPLLRQMGTAFGGVLAGLVSRVDAIAGAAAADAAGWADASATAVAHAIAAPVVGLDQLLAKLIDLLSGAAVTVGNAATGAVDTAMQAALGSVQAAIASVQGTLDLISAQALPALRTDLNTWVSNLQAAIQSVRDDAVQQAQSIEGALTQRIDGAVQSVEAEIAQTAAQATAQAQSIEAGLSDRIEQAIAQVEGEIAADVRALQGEIQGIEGVLGRTIPDIETQVGTIAGQATAATGAVATISAQVATWIQDCGDPLCSTFKPDIPSVQGALALIAEGAVAAWLLSAITEPEATAAVTDAVFGGAVGAAAAVLEAVV